MISTKKLLAPINLKNGNVIRDYLIPDLYEFNSKSFIRLKNEKKEKYGIVVYLGISVSSKDILDRYSKNNKMRINEEKIVKILNEYLTLLQSFKIGNILTIDYNEDGNFILEKIKERPTTKSIKLP